jgi:molybdopterin-binding protein
MDQSRRNVLKGAILGLGAGMVASALSPTAAKAEEVGALIPKGARTLKELAERLAKAPRRRNFKSLPMILTDKNQWDWEALDEVFNYRGGPKQVWDNYDIHSAWLNVMRNAMNAQIWSYKNPDFLCVSATHGNAHFAIYDDYVWETYITPLTKGKLKKNVWLKMKPGMLEKDSPTDESGAFSPADNSVEALIERGAVFLACHNQTWEMAGALLKAGINPHHLTHDELSADLTNHIIPQAIVTPGVVATIPELQVRGFHYITTADFPK